MDESRFSSDNHRVPNALIEARAKQLEQMYERMFGDRGMRSRNYTAQEWIDYIDTSDEKWEFDELVFVYQRVGSPRYPPVEDISPGDMQSYLNSMVEILRFSDIEVDFPDDIDARERYRFITEVIMGELVDDFELDGMTTHFVYDEYPPEDRSQEPGVSINPEVDAQSTPR